MDEPQSAFTAVIGNDHAQLTPTTAERNFAVQHFPFDLHRPAALGIGNAGDAGFVLITQRQVQSQVNSPVQAEFRQRFLGRRFGR